MLRNKLAYELSDISRLSWRTNDRFVDLFINNDYRGTYQLTEKLEESVDRLDIGEDGVLIEADTPIKYKPGDITFRTNKEMFKIKEPKVNKDDAVYNAIKRDLIIAEDALFQRTLLTLIRDTGSISICRLLLIGILLMR